MKLIGLLLVVLIIAYLAVSHIGGGPSNSPAEKASSPQQTLQQAQQSAERLEQTLQQQQKRLEQGQ